MRELPLRQKVTRGGGGATFGGAAVERGDGEPLWPRLCGDGPCLHSEMRRQRGWGINPWATHTRFILSQALVRDEAYAGPLRDWLGDAGKQALLILDEAHNAAPVSGSKFAIDSKLTRALRDLAGRFEHKLFLSATPHNGHSNSFSALLKSRSHPLLPWCGRAQARPGRRDGAAPQGRPAPDRCRVPRGWSHRR